ncbi:hypothetical protein L9F63_013927, partial [Diploptera punctata]
YVLSLFGLLCVLSTVYDIKVTNSGKKKDILRAFSWYTNGKKLLKIRSSSDEKMKCLPGLKFLSIMWIIIGHSYFMQGTIPATNMNTYRKALSGWDHFPVGISIFSVESFFLMSGLLVGNTFFKTTEEGKKVNIFLFYILRYVRLTPVLALATLIHSGLILHMDSGPLWDKQIEQTIRVCKKNWWTTLLYCVKEAWYLAVDTQLYILSSLFLIPLLKRPRFGPKILYAAMIISITTSFLQLYINNVTFGFQAER